MKKDKDNKKKEKLTDDKNFSRRKFLKNLGLGASALTVPSMINSCLAPPTLDEEICEANDGDIARGLPNIIVILADDLGWGDVDCFWPETSIETPGLTAMSEEGCRFLSFYVAAPVCTPSRAALMTGCYPERVNLPRVIKPPDKMGLNPKETTIAELVKCAGYATMCVGKWHLGHCPEFLPHRHGFDEWYGLPYSNDMPGVSLVYSKAADDSIEVIEGPLSDDPNKQVLNKSTLTERYTDKAVEFIANNKDRSFFLYMSHTAPHVPLYDDYKTAVENIDYSTRRIISALKYCEIDDNTLIIFTSDNGPWLEQEDDGGNLGPFKDGKGKGTVYEGGMRVPTIMKWPGKIPENSVCTQLASTLDLYPTIASIAGVTIPSHTVTRDGMNIIELMKDPNGVHPHLEFPDLRLFAYFDYNESTDRAEVCAIRDHNGWKLHTKTNKLFYVNTDINESNNLYYSKPLIVERLRIFADVIDSDVRTYQRPTIESSRCWN